MLSQIKNIVVIAGCQRSGTTMTGLVLGAHRQAILIDEDEGLYDWSENCLLAQNSSDRDAQTESLIKTAELKYKEAHRPIRVFNGQRKLGPEIDTLILKAPNLTYDFERLAKLDKKVSVLFPVRDPRAVVASMEKLNHIDMIGNQIRHIERRSNVADLFQTELAQLKSDQFSDHEKRALIWKIKTGMFEQFENSGLNPFMFNYENFIADNEGFAKQMAKHIGLPFDENMARHETLYRGMAPGLTLRFRAVDQHSKENWRSRLNLAQQTDIMTTANPLAEKLGYLLDKNKEKAPREVPVFSQKTFESPIILTGRGGSGTRLISEIAQKSGVFLGNRLNHAGDSLEWVELIYEMAIKRTIAQTRRREFDEDFSDLLMDKVQDILEAGTFGLKGLWGWKLPETMLIVPELWRYFPKARLVHLVRHPVTSSLRRTHMTSRHNNPIGRAVLRGAYHALGLDPATIKNDPEYLHNAVTWHYQVKLVHEYAMSQLNAENYHFVRLEDFIDDATLATNKLVRFLGGDTSRLIAPEMNMDRLNQTALCPKAVNRVWDICGDLAMELGYMPLTIEDGRLEAAE